MRHAVQKGYEALYTLQELNHLLLSPVISRNPLAREEIITQVNRAVGLLSQAVGIRTAPYLYYYTLITPLSYPYYTFHSGE
jgi:hypothetical protein